MKLDLLYEIDVPRPWPEDHPYGQRNAEQRAYREAIEQLRLADTLGFNIAWMVEHHFRENRSHMPAPEVVIGALTQATKNLQLGFGVTLMPHGFTHPARVAEKIATADVLSGGRVVWGTGRSSPMEQAAFKVDAKLSRDQWKAAIKTVVGMWAAEYYEEHSEFLDFPSRMVTPKPIQDPHPPCWMAATSEGSAAVAGANGLGLLSLSILQPLDKLARLVKEYRSAQQKAVPLTSVRTNQVAAYTLVHCVESRDQLEENRVWESIWWWYRGLAEFTLKWEFPHLSKEQQGTIFPLLEIGNRPDFDPRVFDREDMIIIGTPEECIRKIQRYGDLGIDQVICYVQFGYIPHEAVMRSLELLGKRVIPVLNAQLNGKAAS
jgi:alkanesulfonate monooxygenase SsuD/methylene tetrahydromethanopterin reductase-like flavin-dependent oxidoreductase (luciferase family)